MLVVIMNYVYKYFWKWSEYNIKLSIVLDFSTIKHLLFHFYFLSFPSIFIMSTNFISIIYIFKGLEGLDSTWEICNRGNNYFNQGEKESVIRLRESLEISCKIFKQAIKHLWCDSVYTFTYVFLVSRNCFGIQ